MNSSTPSLWTSTFQVEGLSGQFVFFNIIMFIEIPVIIVNSVNPDQKPRSVASDFGLHCLPMFILWDGRHKGLFFFCDVSKAFDRVCHSGLFHKLKAAGITGYLLQWFVSSLVNSKTMCCVFWRRPTGMVLKLAFRRGLF